MFGFEDRYNTTKTNKQTNKQTLFKETNKPTKLKNTAQNDLPATRQH